MLPCWNSTSGFDFGHIVSSVLFCISNSNISNYGKAQFHSNRNTHSWVMTSWLFQAGGNGVANVLPCSFRFGDVLHLRRSETVSILNFDKISQPWLRYNYFRFWKQMAVISKFYFRLILSFSSSLTSDFAPTYLILCSASDSFNSRFGTI